MKKAVITISLIVMSLATIAQLPNLDSAKSELYKINKVFDSSRYLGFDVEIIYSSDTVLGKFEHDELVGKYILNDHNMYYKMGSTEYIQNDSFAYNIYHDEKMLMMTKVPSVSNSSQFPLKDFLDSTLAWYDSAYTINLRDEDSSRVIEFVANTSGLPYKRFAVYYESDSHYPDKIVMTFIQGITELSSDVPDPVANEIKSRPVEKRIVMLFSNYYTPWSLEIFNDENYVYFDRIRKKYQPSEKYNTYDFLTNGIEEDDYDERFELPAPSSGGN